MNEPLVYSLVLPEVEYLHHYDINNHYNFTMEAWQAGKFLSFFSGSLLNVTTGCTLAQAGISGSHSEDFKVYAIYLNDNSYLSSGSDVTYLATLYNFYTGIPLNYYSASTISNINALTIKQFTVSYIG